MTRKQSVGVNIKNSSVDASGDIVGRDKIEKHEQYVYSESVEEKSGFAFQIERIVIFVFSLLIGGAIFITIGALIGALIGGEIGGEGGAIIGGTIGLILAIGIAIANTSNVSRYKQRL